LLAIPFSVTLVVCIYHWASPSKKLWGNLALVFNVVYASLVSISYFVSLTVVPRNALKVPADTIALVRPYAK
jgi:hypothetical protein